MEERYGSFNAQTQLTRREFIKAGFSAALSALLAACGIGLPNESTAGVTPVPVAPQPRSEGGSDPPEESNNIDLFEKYALAPTEFVDADDPPTRVETAVSYLRRYLDATREAPALPIPTLSALRIVDPDNYPIDITGATVAPEAVGTFMAGMETNIPSETSLRVFYDPNLQGGNAGTSATFESISGIWVPRVAIRFSAAIMTPGDRFESGRRDNPLTDGELAAKLVHEGFHVLQTRALANLLNASPEALASVGESPDQASDWIVRRDELERRRIRDWAAGQSPQLVQWLQASYPNEAQANAGMFAWYDSLKELSGGRHVHGMGELDPPEDKRSLYGLYRQHVIGDSALSPMWLIEGGGGI